MAKKLTSSCQLIASDRFLHIIGKFSELKPMIVIGDVGVDKYTEGVVKRISPEAPVPVLEVQREWPKLGLAANISHNLKTLGVNSTLCGIIGNDERASTFEHLLEESQLKTWGIVRSSHRPTIFKERITTSTQQICRVDYEVTEPLVQEDEKLLLERIEDFSGDHAAYILEDYSKGTMTKKLLERTIAIAKEGKKLLAVDPGRKTHPKLYQGAGLLKPNLEEAKLMVEAFGHSYQKLELVDMANIIMERLELKYLVITLGAQGMALLDASDGELKHIPTMAQEVFDVSGAGDTTISLLTACLMAGSTLEEAACISNCGAGVVVGKHGTATVNIQELTDFYQAMAQKLQSKPKK